MPGIESRAPERTARGEGSRCVTELVAHDLLHVLHAGGELDLQRGGIGALVGVEIGADLPWIVKPGGTGDRCASSRPDWHPCRREDSSCRRLPSAWPRPCVNPLKRGKSAPKALKYVYTWARPSRRQRRPEESSRRQGCQSGRDDAHRSPLPPGFTITTEVLHLFLRQQAHLSRLVARQLAAG